MRGALRFLERATQLTELDFKAWASKMEKLGKVNLRDDPRQDALIMNVHPRAPTDTAHARALPGIIHQTGLLFDDDGNVIIFFATDVEKYCFSVYLVRQNNSFADMQVQATADVYL